MAMKETKTESIRWTAEETRALLHYWSDETIQDQLDGTVRDSEVYKKIAVLLQSDGFSRTATQVKTRLKILKKLYRVQKDKLNTSGSNSKVTFQYYKQMDSVLGHRPAIAPQTISESVIAVLENTDESFVEDDRSQVNMELAMNADFSQTDNAADDERGDLTQISEQPDDDDYDVNDEEVVPPSAVQPGPSTRGPKPKRKKKALKDVIPETFQKSVESLINYQKTVDERMFTIEEQHLEIERENLRVKQEALEYLKNIFRNAE